MNTFKKVLLYVGMVIAVIMLIVTTASIIGTWYLNTPVTETALGILEPVTETLQSVEMLAGGTAASLDDVSTIIVQIDQRVDEIGDEVNEANVTVEAISALVGEDITPKIDEINAGILSVYDVVGAFQGAIQSFNAIPFIDFELPGDEELGSLQSGMEDIARQARDLSKALSERKKEIVDGAVEIVRTPLNGLNKNVVESRDRWSDFEMQTRQTKEDLLYVQENIAEWIDLLCIVITLVLLWIIISQVAVFQLCRKYL